MIALFSTRSAIVLRLRPTQYNLFSLQGAKPPGKFKSKKSVYFVKLRKEKVLEDNLQGLVRSKRLPGMFFVLE